MILDNYNANKDTYLQIFVSLNNNKLNKITTHKPRRYENRLKQIKLTMFCIKTFKKFFNKIFDQLNLIRTNSIPPHSLLSVSLSLLNSIFYRNKRPKRP